MQMQHFIQQDSSKELCRFITCGSVDDGKSTLIGRMLYDSKMIFDDQIQTLQKDSKKYGTQNGNLDFALLVDGLASEREQGITIDVAYRFFASQKRKFIIADTPGHEQYTRNMATGASNADIAILLIDATKGILNQTKRHSYICALLGIKHFIIAVNKMDLIHFSKETFNQICNTYQSMQKSLPNCDSITLHFVPISALCGDNITQNSNNTPWYHGKSLLTLLDTIPLHCEQTKGLILPIQYVNRPNPNFRAFCGNIVAGAAKINDEIIILPSLQKSKIKNLINTSDYDSKIANYPNAISLELEDEIDISRGDIIAHTNHNLKLSDNFEAMLIWLNNANFNPKGNYLIKLAHSLVNISSFTILSKIDINTFKENPSATLELNAIAKCKLSINKTLALTEYAINKSLGSFIVIDKYSNQTLAAGMIYAIPHKTTHSQRFYTEAEKSLNTYIRQFYPEWECKKI